ncbi:MAG: purine-binding chemotaxis protein CheW [Rhodocyclaceae bacterium]|nr:MAG: purine-binding chemotaxis protein CheW [Rhodocyclaceae bacterium]
MNKQNASAPRRIIDWSDVHRRLERVRQAVETGGTPDEAETTRILAARARALAVPARKKKEGERIEVIEFLLSGEHYGLEFAYVREVFPLVDLTRLPCTPPFVLGIVNVRGEIVSVVDLRKFFDLPEKGLSDLNKVIILHSGEITFGILADVVVGVKILPRNELQPSLPTLTELREEYLLGVTREPMAVLDAAKLLADPHIVVEESVPT